MSLSDKFAALNGQGSDRKGLGTPEAWRPRMELDRAGGFIVSSARAAGEQPDAADLLAEFDLDPSAWRVLNVRRSRWQRWDGEWLEAYRLSLEPVAGGADLDYEALVEEVRRWRPGKAPKPAGGERTALFAVGDTQWGKDAGDGSDGTVRRYLDGLDLMVARVKAWRRLGYEIGTIALAQMGDCIEGSASQQGRLLARSDMGVTGQVRLGRRMLMAQIKAMSSLAEQIVVPVVPGNHDEPHRIQVTDPVDSWQVEIAAAVQDACAENPALEHVRFRYPAHDTGALAVDLSGTLVGFAHGHQSRDAVKWWHGQATGRTEVGGADVLVTAHFHHYRVQQVGPRLWVQTPALDGGSPWWKDHTGLDSPPGIVALVVGDGVDPRQELSVLPVTRHRDAGAP